MAAVTDFRIEIGFFSHLKTRRLERKLGAAGVLGLLRVWEYAATNAPDGMLRGCDDEELAILANWDGEPAALVSGLMAAGFVFRAADGFELHDWAEHQQWVVGAPERAKRSRRAAVVKHERERGNSTTTKAERLPAACQPHATGMPDCDSGTAPAFPAFPALPTSPSERGGGAHDERPAEPEPPTAGDDWRMAEDLARRSIREGRMPQPDRAGRPYPHTLALIDRWNERMPPPRRLDARQRKALAKTVLPADLCPLEDFEAILDAALRSPLLSGRDRKWAATLAWLLEPEHWQDVLGGKYALLQAIPRAGPPVPVVQATEAHETSDADRREAKVTTTMLRLAMERGLGDDWEHDTALRAEAERIAGDAA